MIWLAIQIPAKTESQALIGSINGWTLALISLRRRFGTWAPLVGSSIRQASIGVLPV